MWYSNMLVSSDRKETFEVEDEARRTTCIIVDIPLIDVLFSFLLLCTQEKIEQFTIVWLRQYERRKNRKKNNEKMRYEKSFSS